MDDLFTTKQVQELLKVDRITIYRMLQDGRIKGVKIGQQWRFPRKEVERLMNGEVLMRDEVPVEGEAETVFPVHCLQTIQDLFSGVSRISALILDPEGHPVTEVSSPCEFCRLVHESPAGESVCQEAYREAVTRNGSGEPEIVCAGGLRYAVAPITVDGRPVAFFLAGQFLWQSDAPIAETGIVRKLSAECGIPRAELEQAAAQVPVFAEDRREQIQSWARAAVTAAESILQERTGFVQRLQQIANLTHLS